jgi:hypothetical protein
MKAVDLGLGDVLDHRPDLVDLIPYIISAAKRRGLCP